MVQKWTIQLDERFFTDARFQGGYQDKSRRWVSQVFLNDDRPLQRIGADPIYKNEGGLQLATVGRGLDDLIQDSFSDFCGLSVGKCKDCTVRHCDLSYNGNTGMGMGECQDCLVEGCTLLFNNYRRFHSGWH